MRGARVLLLVCLTACLAPVEPALDRSGDGLGFETERLKQERAPGGVRIIPGSWTREMTLHQGATGLQFALRAGDTLRGSIEPTHEAGALRGPAFDQQVSVVAYQWVSQRWQPVPAEASWGRGTAVAFAAPTDGVYLLVVTLPSLAHLRIGCAEHGAPPYRTIVGCASCARDPGVCQRIDPGSTLTCGHY